MPIDENGNEPLVNYSGVRKLSDLEFVILHKTDESKNINYTLFKSKLIHYEILLSDKVTIKYNNQRNSFYQPVHESVYFEVLKF